MLPGLRTVFAAVFATPIVATFVAAFLMRAPVGSLTYAIASPPLEHAQVAPAQGANAKEQSRMLGYAPVTELPSIAPETGTIDGGTSTFGKTQEPVDTAENVTQTSGSAPAPAEVVANANSQGSDPAVTGSVNASSSASGHRRNRFRGLVHARLQARARAQSPAPNAEPAAPSERDRNSSPL